MGNWTENLKGWLLNLFLESKCPLCQRSTPVEFCQDCQRQLQLCQITNPKKLWNGDLPVFAWGVYGGVLKRALAALKYENKTQIAQPLGYWLGENWIKSSLATATNLTVVPIPLHAKKQQERGYNQADLLAESFCRITGLSLQRHGLERWRETKPQFGLSAAERKQNLTGAFGLGKAFRDRRPDSAILLLDDIYTSGETAREAANTLRQHDIGVHGIVAIATSKQGVSSANTKLVN